MLATTVLLVKSRVLSKLNDSARADMAFVLCAKAAEFPDERSDDNAKMPCSTAFEEGVESASAIWRITCINGRGGSAPGIFASARMSAGD